LISAENNSVFSLLVLSFLSRNCVETTVIVLEKWKFLNTPLTNPS